MTEHGNELRKAADTLRKASREINLAIEQCTRSRHLFIRVRRSVVQASRAVVNVVDLGFNEIWPTGSWMLSVLRNPNDPITSSATIDIGDFHADLLSLKIGSGCNSDGTPADDTAFSVWTLCICPAIRVRQSTAKADAGAFDFSPVKTDGERRILGRDGQLLTKVEGTEDAEGGSVGWRLSGPAARVSDDYDEVDFLEHLRCQAADWADACDQAKELILIEVGRCEGNRGEADEIHHSSESDRGNPGPSECSEEPERASFYHDGEFWVISAFGEMGSFRDLKGFRAIHRLLEENGKPVPAQELITLGDKETTREEETVPEAIGDRQELYEIARSISETKSELEIAQRDNDEARTQRLNRELEGLLESLKQLEGAGGRLRKWSLKSDSDLRSTQSAIKRAIKKLELATPLMSNIASHLKDSVIHQGAGEFVYRPDKPYLEWVTFRE